MSDKTSWLVKIDTDLKKDFKTLCAEKEQTMQEATEDALYGWLDKQRVKRGGDDEKNGSMP